MSKKSNNDNNSNSRPTKDRDYYKDNPTYDKFGRKYNNDSDSFDSCSCWNRSRCPH